MQLPLLLIISLVICLNNEVLSNRQHHVHNVNPNLISDYCPNGHHERVLGGQVANAGNFPYTASVYKCLPEYKGCLPKCGGSIISQYHILTAANCRFTRVDYQRMSLSPCQLLVRVGVHDLTADSVIEGVNRNTFQVESVIVHPDFIKNSFYPDIAIIKVTSAIIFTTRIQPVCINGIHFNYPWATSNLIMAGWGVIVQTPDLPASNVLKYAVLDYHNITQCIKHPKAGEKYMVYCGVFLNGAAGKPCMGDAGSAFLPLGKDHNPVPLIVGLLSDNAISLCGDPSFVVNVTTFAQWINENAN